MGGLGNQLFQIANGYAHSQRNGYALHISATTNCKRGTYWDTFYPVCKQFRTTQPCTITPFTEPQFHYREIPREARHLIGYFQSSKYFTEYADDIRRLLTPSDIVHASMRQKWGHLLSEESIVVHIRRGDYVPLPQYHCILTADYYVQAVNKMITETGINKVLVFSDDIEWCKTIGLPESSIYVDESDETVALLLMSQFKYYIISNSSFSWWAVWLGKQAKCVYAPELWFGPSGPQDIWDIYESSWEKLPISS